MALHIMISWDVKGEGSTWQTRNDALRTCLKGYSWVKPLTTTYIVQLTSIQDRQEIRARLVDVCRKYPSEINLIISPPMEGGSYSGWLPKDMWPKVQERTGGAQ